MLLDEVEKAHPDIFNILLQVFEDGHLTDGLGNRVNFKNAIIIMTSNIGARFIQKKASMGFQGSDLAAMDKNVSDMVLGEVKRTFNPEFINRVDEIIVFEALGDDDLRRITGLLVDQLNANLADRRMRIHIAPEVIDWIIDVTCKDRSYGARPLRRAIQRYVEDPLSEELIRGHLRDGEVEVYLEGGQIAYRPAGELTAGRQLWPELPTAPPAASARSAPETLPGGRPARQSRPSREGRRPSLRRPDLSRSGVLGHTFGVSSAAAVDAVGPGGLWTEYECRYHVFLPWRPSAALGSRDGWPGR